MHLQYNKDNGNTLFVTNARYNAKKAAKKNRSAYASSDYGFTEQGQPSNEHEKSAPEDEQRAPKDEPPPPKSQQPPPEAEQPALEPAQPGTSSRKPRAHKVHSPAEKFHSTTSSRMIYNDKPNKLTRENLEKLGPSDRPRRRSNP